MENDAPHGTPLSIRPNGSLVYDELVIGRIDRTGEPLAPRLILNLGWLKAAGLGIRIESDPEVDRKRGGVVLDR